MIVLNTNVLSETLGPAPMRGLWHAYAQIAASRKVSGKPISQFDAMIAAIAKSRGASLATRNVKDFIDCGIQVIDPWRS